jgi:flagellin-like protein
MRRRGISEVVSVVLLLAVIAAASYFALSESSKRTIDNERTVTDIIEIKGSQIQELLSVITVNTTPQNTTLEILNYGTKNIIIDRVFLDGIPLPFTLSDSDGSVLLNHTMLPKDIMTLQVSGAGQSIQIVTESQNIISLPLG